MEKKRFVLITCLLVFFAFICFDSYQSRKQTILQSPLLQLNPTATIPSPTPTPFPQITLLAAGDLGLGREINYQIIQKNDPYFPFEKIAPTIRQADWAIANLEGPVIKDCPILRSGYQFCANTENLDGPLQAGFDAFSLANNHINNFGPQGIEETIQALEQRSLRYFGLGKVDFQTLKGIKLAFLSFDDTLAPLNQDQLSLEIKKVDPLVDWVVVNFHWGEEYQPQPNAHQKEIARTAVEAGADIIIGHHPHVPQPLEYIDHKPVFYSLGNFVFDQLWSMETRKGEVAKITLNKDKIIKTETIPIFINDQYQAELLGS